MRRSLFFIGLLSATLSFVWKAVLRFVLFIARVDEASVMSTIQDVERWQRIAIDYIFDWHISPILLLAGLILIGLSLALFDARALLLDLIIRRQRVAFRESFNAHENYIARDAVRRHGALRYQAKAADFGGYPSLAELIDAVRLPDWLPPKEAGVLINLIAHTDWAGAAGVLFQFCEDVYPKNDLHIDRDFHTARQAAAKFWDDWGVAYMEGRISWKHMRPQINSNRRDLVLLTFLELAQTDQIKWDHGPGKRGLFMLSQRCVAAMLPENDNGHAKWRFTWPFRAATPVVSRSRPPGGLEVPCVSLNSR